MLGFGPPRWSQRLETWSYIVVSKLYWLHEFPRTKWLTESCAADHEAGGHFPGLDNPPALLADLREIATYWSG